jgi:hypothetical protein
MRRSVLSAVLVATLSLFACSEHPTDAPTTAPPLTGGPASLVVCTATGIQQQIDALFPLGSLRTSAQAQFSSIPKVVDKESGTAARDKTFAFVDFLLDTYYGGQLVAANLDKVLDLIRSLHCFAKLALPEFPSATSTDFVVGVAFPNQEFTFRTTSGNGAVQGSSDAVTPAMGPVTITIFDLPDQPPPLRTSLDQYPRFYHFSAATATGPVEFNVPVTAAVCLRGSFPTGFNFDNLRLAHNVGPSFGDVEVLPKPTGALPVINCPELGTQEGSLGLMRSAERERFAWAKRLLLPPKLHAATLALVSTGVGGTTKNFSEFGVVDIFSNPGTLSPDGSTSASEEVGGTVTRTVLVTSDNRTAVPGVAVTFATTDGVLVTPQPVVTDAAGRASASWTLPAEPGIYTLTAHTPAEDNPPIETSDPPADNVASTPDVAFDPTSLTFTVSAELRFGFENGEPTWNVNGFWNRSTLVGITNAAFTTGAVQTFVVTSEGVVVPGGALPTPAAGSWAMWYGQPASGNFLTGGAVNAGNSTSPFFVVPSTTQDVFLQLKTWWEIEGVNPRSFDIMQIQLLSASGAVVQILQQLNPLTDPTSPTDRARLAYTSGGFNTAPVWQDLSFNINAHRGQTRAIRLAFRTGDGNFNNFRGWIVDQVAMRVGATAGLRFGALMSANDEELVPVDEMTFPDRPQDP